MTLPRIASPVLFLLATSVLLVGCGSGDDTTEDDAARSGAPTPTTKESAVRMELTATGIGDARIGDERAALVDAMGEPDETRTVPNELSGSTNERMTWHEPHLVVVLDGDGVTQQVETSDETFRSMQGLGVGVAQERVEALLDEDACDAHLCRAGMEEAGAIVTDYFFEDGAVTRVVVGRIID